MHVQVARSVFNLSSLRQMHNESSPRLVSAQTHWSFWRIWFEKHLHPVSTVLVGSPHSHRGSATPVSTCPMGHKQFESIPFAVVVHTQLLSASFSYPLVQSQLVAKSFVLSKHSQASPVALSWKLAVHRQLLSRVKLGSVQMQFPLKRVCPTEHWQSDIAVRVLSMH